MAGVWRQSKAAKKLAITVEPFAGLSRSQRDGLDWQVARLGEVWRMPAELTIGTVASGVDA